MKNLAMTILVFIVLAVVAIALARVTQILAPRVGWPLLVVLAGGGLGTLSLFLWQQQLLSSWAIYLVMTLLAGVLLAVAGHFFDWREAIAASLARRSEAIQKEPRFAALIEEQMPLPSWTEFMQPTTDVAKTWGIWLGDATAKLTLVLVILIVGKRNGWLAARTGGVNE